MRPEYSAEYPLGLNYSKFNPEIELYLSWEELVETTRTNIFTAPDGSKYQISPNKDDKPLFTYKGDYGNRRAKDNLKERSPYVGIDIDVDESASGVSKKNLTDEQRLKAADDLELIISLLTDHKNNFFFCKRSSSGCGLHIFIKLQDAPEDKIDRYEKNIFLKVQEVLDDPEIQKLLKYRYKVDMAMLSGSQALHINHDPSVIFNPEKTTPAKFYPLKTEYGEGKVGEPGKVFIPREGTDYDRRMFLRFAKFIAINKIRMEYTQIMRLALIYFQLWPEGSEEHFFEIFTKLNAERARVKSERNGRFVKNHYYNVRKNTAKEVNGKRITVASLYYIMNLHKYVYTPELDLNFVGYLSSVEDKLFDAFEKSDNILLEAPTGSGKTYTMFKHLKKLAILFPHKNFVVCTPFTGMADQFAAENSDAQFKIKVHHGTKKNKLSGFTQLPGFEENPDDFSKRDEKIHCIFTKDADGFLQNSDEVLTKSNRPKRVIYSNTLTKLKKKSKKAVIKTPEPLFTPPPPLQVYHNIWCTTYDSAPQIKNIHTLIIDEAHDLVKQIGFRQAALKELSNVPCQKRICITATPDALLPEVEDFYHISCIKTDAVKPELKIIKVKGAVTDALKINIREAPSSLSFYNNKPHCQQIQSDLLREGVEVSLYNRDTKEEPHQKALQKESLLTANALATTYLLEGFNVNSEVQRINICNDYDIDNIRQGAARPRKCIPVIHLLLKETKYEPGKSWRFNRAYEFVKEYARLEVLAEKLNEISCNVTGDENINLFTAFEGDTGLIYRSPDKSSYMLGHERFPYVVDVEKLKANINERYMHWLYHKQDKIWLKKLSKYFNVTESIILENNLKDPKRKQEDFEVFRNAGDELIYKFVAYEKFSRKNKDLKYDEEMRSFAKENKNLQFKTDWKRWTERYLKMCEYGVVDFDIIKSGINFSRWQKQADFAVSSTEGGKTAREIYVANPNKAAVDFLLKVDLNAINYTSELLFRHLNIHLRDLKLPSFKSQKSFFNSIKLALKLKTKQVRNTGTRYITEITDIRPLLTYMTVEKRRELKVKLSGEDYSNL